jgi:predicted nucleic acid-binding protein
MIGRHLGPRNQPPQLLARDALHLPVMEQPSVERILSFDAGFDEFPGIARLY